MREEARGDEGFPLGLWRVGMGWRAPGTLAGCVASALAILQSLHLQFRAVYLSFNMRFLLVFRLRFGLLGFFNKKKETNLLQKWGVWTWVKKRIS